MKMRNWTKLFLLCLIGLFLFFSKGFLFSQKHPSELKKPEPIKVELPEPENFEVGHGITVYYLEDREFPVVNLTAYFKGGSLYDPPDKLGLARLMATVMRTGGTDKMSAEELDAELEFLPAPMGVNAGGDYLGASFQCLKKHFPRVLELYTNILFSPAFNQEKFDHARDQWKQRMKTRWNNPRTIMALLFNRLLVGPEGVRLVTPQTVNNITRKDLIECYKKYFVPNNMHITIGGDISASEAKESLNKAFKDWQAKEIDFPELPKIEDKSTNKIYYVYKNIPQANILIGHYIDMNWDHPDIHKMQIMNAIFGDGFTSRLNKEIRVKRGWTYGISGGIRWGRANGSFRISSSLKAESLGEALSIIKEIVQGMQTDLVTDKELEKTKLSRIYASVFKNRNPLRIVSNKMYRKHIQGRPEVDENKRLEKIRNVTKEDLREMAKTYIETNNLMMVIVGNKEKFDKPLEEFGEVVEVNIEEIKKKDLAEKGEG